MRYYSACRSILFWLVLSCFFLSGAAGLMYEVLWLRMIDKIIGSAPFAVSTVLSVFMGGLALGSWAVGRHIYRFDSRKALLAFYGKLEIAIGVYAMFLPLLIEAVTPIYSFAYNYLIEYFWLYQFFGFAGAFILLIVPAGLMGGTMPVLCQFYISRIDHLGTRTGRLYGLNTIGAAFGALLCGFVLISSLGVQKTLYAAAGINFFVGILCILASRQQRTLFSSSPALKPIKISQRQSRETAAKSEKHSDQATRWALWLFAVSGFCAMAYQVFWTKLIALLIGPTTYSFTLVVATFIVGLSAGSIFFGWLGDKVKRVFLLLVATQILAAGSALAVSHFLGNSQFLFSKIIFTFQDRFQIMLLVQCLVLFGFLIGPTLFLGAAFPLVSRIYARSLSGLGKSVGEAYAVNTIGAIAGSFAAGFILIPLMGKEQGLTMVILLQFLTAFSAFSYVKFRGRWKQSTQKYHWVTLAALAVTGVFLILCYPSWNRNILSRGWYRNFQDLEWELEKTSWYDALRRGPEFPTRQQANLDVVFYGDGIGGFTTVEKEITSIGTAEYALNNSGKPDASSHGDRLTQTLSGHFPMLFHPNPEKVMVIGLASGMTIGEVLLYPVEKVDVLEINEQVVKACRMFFTPFNNDCLNDSRTRLIIQDGRNHLALTREKYDVIISEPSNPWMSGLANLYSLDFFQLVRNRLDENGIFAQWIQSYEIDRDTFDLVGRTFRKVFPQGVLVKLGPGDYLLMGFAGPKCLDWKIAGKNIEYARRSDNAAIADYRFLAWLVVTEDLGEFFQEGPLHTDNHPRLEFAAPRKLYGTRSDPDQVVKGKRRFSPETLNMLSQSTPAQLLDLVEFFASVHIPLFHAISYKNLSPMLQNRYYQIVTGFCEQTLVPSYSIFPETALKKECAEIQMDKIEQKISRGGGGADDYYNLGLSMIAAGRREGAASSLEAAISVNPLHADSFMAMGLLLAGQGKTEKAAEYFKQTLTLSPMNAQAKKYLGIAEFQKGNFEQAVFYLSKALEIMPDDADIKFELGKAQHKLKKSSGS